ncbi:MULTISPECIES: TRAP transporter small permease subunit [Thalassospira]|jgi:TRAP-type mannitol/chloroaromatic compound transport system permease small subunit|uniref:TRAP transporter small permease protein n=2 Tax=Thalassospira TaxID=168934 RepID=A0A358HR47_9PROT|nr:MULTISPECIES: TRAP transporter small permease subunit [Thalassospira]PKR59689.1 C4-dicarboxylate ABC transporter permease [Thalassospira lohafexi]RCK25807.1 C4-dicarboxylate ABC transporter permease [Thalassospira lucentensis MCCC 1A00383 = DSM 14000]HBU97234.1 C4-dicarboxylate ABC transporter permease [Thalassospira lucentensis]HCW66633.1 C4-dicarboxylate ABC transporter permease [Thalassospira lucentensis]|tara:strand:- start:71 stop:580 length:510 start_codon:yes stop_codon:yes gene_type:complete
MPEFIKTYVRWVDRVNRIIGRFAMYLIFAMLAVLIYSSVTKLMEFPALWTLEAAQFIMVSYFLLGGGYSMQLDSHVRMDLLYGALSPRKQAGLDAITILFLIFYLAFLLYGGISSTSYAFQYNETSYSAWSPPMTPIKSIMTFGVFMMLLQAIATFFKDLAAARGESLS